MTLSHEIVAMAKAHLARFARPGYVVEFEDGEGPRTANKLFGAAYLLPGEAWPRCPFCNNKMTLLLQVAVTEIIDVAPGLDRRGLLQFFYCLNTCERIGGWECNGTYGWDVIKDRNNLARVVIPEDAGGTDDPPDHRETDIYQLDLHPRHVGGAGRPVARRIRGLIRQADLPDPREDCVRVGLQDDLDIAELRRMLADDDMDSGRASRVAIGGWPFWVQAPEWPNCPTCGKIMRKVISLSPYEAFHLGTDVYINVFYCEMHPQIFAVELQSD